MKVLWFSLSPCGSLRRDNKERVIQGWLISLEDELKKLPNIELEVAYFASKKETPFLFDGVRYYPMGAPSAPGPLSRVLNRMSPLDKQDRQKIQWMLDVVKKSNPDIIHIHGTEESFGWVADLISNVPVVYSIQGLIAPYTEKFFAGISKTTERKVFGFFDRIKHATKLDEYRQFQQAAKREIHFLSKAKFIFGRTSWDRNCTLVMNPNRKYYEVNEILRDSFYKIHWKGSFAQDMNIKLVSVISGMLYKGLETILKAAYMLKQNASFNFEWNIVGITEKDKFVLMSEIEAGINSEHVHIKYLGKKGAEELASILSQSDLYIHPSHIENSPNSVCEAMIVGIPVLATNVGGTSSMLDNNVDGILIQDGDPFVMAGAIIDILNNPVRSYQMAQNGKKKAMERHDKKKIINELIIAYTKIVESYE